MLENEELNSGVEQASSEPLSSESGEQQAQAQAPETTQDAQGEGKPQEKYVPYNRFQEVITQKNQFAEQLKAMQAQQAEMQRQMQEFRKPAAPKTEDPLIARLKGIDPEFGERFEKVSGFESKLAEFEQWQKNMEMERLRTDAYSTINKLHDENKVDPGFREFYNSQIELAVLKNQKLGLKDLPEVYKEVHTRLSKQFEDFKRAERESYVTSKKADAKTPSSQPKATAVNPSKPAEWSKDPNEAKAQLIQRVLNSSKASNSI